VLRLARMDGDSAWGLFWQPGLGRTSKITRRYLSTSDIERGNDEKLVDDRDIESSGLPELVQVNAFVL
jgi:hypothetical protein